MYFLKVFLWGLASFFIVQPGFSQSTAEWVWRPEYTHIGRVSDDLTYSAKLSFFNSFDYTNNRSKILNVQPQFSLTYRLHPRLRVGGGLLYRLSSATVDKSYYEFRTSQDFGSIRYFDMRRFVHRLRAEQRFRSTSYANRVRYRIRYNLSLEGKLLQPGDHYLIFSNELLSGFKKQDVNAENRFATGMGWFHNRYRRFEVTFEYRTRDILHPDGVIHLFMMKTALFTSR
jgi:hypothetical protein